MKWILLQEDWIGIDTFAFTTDDYELHSLRILESCRLQNARRSNERRKKTIIVTVTCSQYLGPTNHSTSRNLTSNTSLFFQTTFKETAPFIPCRPGKSTLLPLIGHIWFLIFFQQLLSFQIGLIMISCTSRLCCAFAVPEIQSLFLYLLFFVHNYSHCKMQQKQS